LYEWGRVSVGVFGSVMLRRLLVGRGPSSFRRGVVIGGSVLAFGFIAGPAEASTPPLTELTSVEAQLSALSSSADQAGKLALSGAVSQLGAAAAPSLWSDPSDAVPPPEGDAVFTSSQAALVDLAEIQNDPTVPSSALTAARNAILGACAELADTALRRAGLPATSRPGGSVQDDQTDYDRAFQALGAQVTRAIATIPQRTVDQAAEAFLRSPNELFDNYPQPATGAPLSVDGKPELFYYGAEGCPFCAVDRWSMALALSRFGQFSPLALSVSSTLDYEPSTNTLSFYGARYQSPALAFVPVEAYTNQPGQTPCGYPWSSLQNPTPSQQQLLAQYDEIFGCPAAVPFVDVADRWTTIGSYPDPTQINGLSWEQIAAAMSDPSSPVAQYIDGAAEILAAQLCQVTGQQPAGVCHDSVNRQYQQLLTTGPTDIDPPALPLNAVSCASARLCVAVDAVGNAVVTHDPNAATPTWRAPIDIDGTNTIGYISCPSTSLCVAVDYSGNAVISRNPDAATPTWSAPADIDGTDPMVGVSCPSTSLCVAVDYAGNAVISRNPDAATPTWSAPADIDGTNAIVSDSCPSVSLCVAVDAAGNVLVSHDPDAATPTWAGPTDIDGSSELDAVSCSSGSLCVAVDATGNALVSHNPAAATPTWSGPDDIDGTDAIENVLCVSMSLCVAVDASGNALVTHNLWTATPNWSAPKNLDALNPLYGISCPSTAMCVTVASNGYAYVTNDPTAANPTWNAHANSAGQPDAFAQKASPSRYTPFAAPALTKASALGAGSPLLAK
jgi:hypothetical protein